MHLLHHIDVVKSGRSRAAPADVLKAAGHVFLPVEIVWYKTMRPKRCFRAGEHLRDILICRKRRPVLEQIRALFERQRMDRDVAGV